jgi:hypothetical protein
MVLIIVFGSVLTKIVGCCFYLEAHNRRWQHVGGQPCLYKQPASLNTGWTRHVSRAAQLREGQWVRRRWNAASALLVP